MEFRTQMSQTSSMTLSEQKRNIFFALIFHRMKKSQNKFYERIATLLEICHSNLTAENLKSDETNTAFF